MKILLDQCLPVVLQGLSSDPLGPLDLNNSDHLDLPGVLNNKDPLDHLVGVLLKINHPWLPLHTK